MSKNTRTEYDSLGPVEVDADKLWGAQTERSRRNFQIGAPASMPIEIIRAYAQIKQAAALTNASFGRLAPHKAELIVRVCEEILAGDHDAQFPLVIWQTGSGTHTNMNVNEVIANRAQLLSGRKLSDRDQVLHPNDDVNMSQSSNDTFPSAMHIAAYRLTQTCTLPGIQQLRDTFERKQHEFSEVVKVGRTHFMDATPLTLGQEFGAYVQQLDNGMRAIRHALEMVAELALGGSAVGTGLNTPPGFAAAVAEALAHDTGYPFVTAPNKFEAIAAHDALVELSGAFRRLAVSLMKIANDIRMLCSGPRCGIGEILIPNNEPGSSIMPGKVNPTQAEAVTMVAAEVMGNDVAVGIAGSNGQFQLNTFKPLIAANVINSARLLGDACASFNIHCASGIEPNLKVIDTRLNNSLMLITSLNSHIGYAKGAKIAKLAHVEGLTLREATLRLGYLSAEDFDRLVDPTTMLHPS
ncbi:MAG: fumarate hydratase class II [Gammaproteobacteria bacterium]|jgi:fumarate hydratase class II